MKTLLVALAASFMLAASTPPASEVYICNGPKSKKYHLKENCRGLRYCSTEVSKVTLEQAKDKGRTLCGYED